MKRKNFRKYLVIGIIFLFVGAGVVSSHSGDSNNIGSQNNDLAILKITSPHNGDLSNWVPEVLVCNFGSSAETNVDITVTIEGFEGCGTNMWVMQYRVTRTVPIINPCETQIVSFIKWFSAPEPPNTIKKYQVTAEIQKSDPRPENNKKYEIFNLGNGKKLTIDVPFQFNVFPEFQINIKNNLGVPACCVDYEIDLISYFLKSLPPLVCNTTIGAVTIPVTGTTIKVPSPMIPVNKFSRFVIKIVIADTNWVAWGFIWRPSSSNPPLLVING
jgi:hypothetical protein